MFPNKFADKKIILASQSPRRHALLKEIVPDFDIISASHMEESFPAEMNPEQVPEFLSKKKADYFTKLIDEKTVLITADTIVLYNGRILNKPQDYRDAKNMLHQLSNNMHTVITGVCLKSITKEKLFSAHTNVYFDALKTSEIEYYIKNFKPYDKAGSYGIQEWIGYIGISKIEGSYFNVMGLPVHQLYRELIGF